MYATEGSDQSGQSGVDLSLLDELTAELAEVQSALERLDAGTYGQCDRCGRPIDDATLDSYPTARFCADHLPDSP